MKAYQFRFILFAIVLFFYSKSCFSDNSYTEQENQYKIEIERFKNEGNDNQVAFYYNKLGYLYWDKQNLDDAINCFKQSITYNKRIGNNNAIKNLYSNLGMIYSDMQNYETALMNFRKCLNIAKEGGNKKDILSRKLNVSLTLSTINRNQEAIEMLEKAQIIAKEIGDMKLLRACYGQLHENYQKIGNNDKSFEYFNLYASFDKEIQKKEIQEKEVETKHKINAIEQQKNKAEREKEDTKIELKKTEESLEKVEEINRQKQMELELKELTLKEQQATIKFQQTLTYAFIVVVILIALIAYFIYRNLRHKKIANQKLKVAFQRINKQNEDITKSINYAQRIQDAMLPNIESVNKYIPESFIMFHPRDIVSGDFYFLSKTPGNKENKNISGINDFIVSAVDCTGHGVPGAFMSMIGYNILTEILGKGIVSVDKILNELHIGVRTALKQDRSNNKDGMDLAMCRIIRDKNILEYSGARNPLIYIQNNELHQIKGYREGIGGSQREEMRIFEKHIINITSPTVCYIFSDGYADQFGGDEGMKFMIKFFKKFLLEIHQKPMKEQKQILIDRFEEWKGDKFKQLDDVLVIGFKIDPVK